MVKPYYQDDAVTLYHADCRDVLPTIPNGVVVTDPPYNIGYHYEGYKDNLTAEEYQELLRASCRKPSVVLHYMEDLIALSWAIEEIPSKVVAWVYPSNTARQWRGIAWFGIKPELSLGGGQDYRNPTDPRIAERIMRGEQARLYDWWEVNQVKNVGEEKTAHPCQIPQLVMQRIIRITSADLIIDPFAGSGTTGRACKDLGRKCVLIEREEKYCEIAAKRMAQEVLF